MASSPSPSVEVVIKRRESPIGIEGDEISAETKGLPKREGEINISCSLLDLETHDDNFEICTTRKGRMDTTKKGETK
eukprot:CAMPEP_0175048002 /NCGR_PEP_ID=MMETSP0052_2-20121109/5924_1 /TAXON_ID=51329 ORGANISM="Polytomella parva, Strain SAG 63-3" /NCGR_SAMPLE_ID=MMETSP0052_2 /ASSEMBLY_ACC=CAM_ASM_000194 /LENGTH=76 /DNA_ID=CAMNT_0016311971 /DNA_START=699 /DNA_END=929 /DNA_ORIENTATION=+